MNTLSEKSSTARRPVELSKALAEWNLVLLAISPRLPRCSVEYLEGAIREAGGWVLQRGNVSEQCADIDFEFPRSLCLDIYSVLLGNDIELSGDAHVQLTGLAHCTQHASGSARCEVARIHLSVYYGEGAEVFLASSTRQSVQAA
jgi:hypothetical protein